MKKHENEILTRRVLFKIWEMALNEIQNSIKQPEESNGIYLARCWSQGFIRALKSEGIKLCLVIKDEEVFL